MSLSGVARLVGGRQRALGSRQRRRARARRRDRGQRQPGGARHELPSPQVDLTRGDAGRRDVGRTFDEHGHDPIESQLPHDDGSMRDPPHNPSQFSVTQTPEHALHRLMRLHAAANMAARTNIRHMPHVLTRKRIAAGPTRATSAGTSPFSPAGLGAQQAHGGLSSHAVVGGEIAPSDGHGLAGAGASGGCRSPWPSCVLFAGATYMLSSQLSRADRTLDVVTHTGTVTGITRSGPRSAIAHVHLDDGRDVDALSQLSIIPPAGTHVVVSEFAARLRPPDLRRQAPVGIAMVFGGIAMTWLRMLASSWPAWQRPARRTRASRPRCSAGSPTSNFPSPAPRTKTAATTMKARRPNTTPAPATRSLKALLSRIASD